MAREKIADGSNAGDMSAPGLLRQIPTAPRTLVSVSLSDNGTVLCLDSHSVAGDAPPSLTRSTATDLRRARKVSIHNLAPARVLYVLRVFSPR